ncbi:hypothetical protein HID58_084455, partial [Brassica napus]
RSRQLQWRQRNGQQGRKKKHKVNQLKPGTSGHTLTVKVVDRYSVPCIIRPGRIAECLVGDETASIIFTARNDQVDLMKPGTTVNLRNTKINIGYRSGDIGTVAVTTKMITTARVIKDETEVVSHLSYND